MVALPRPPWTFAEDCLACVQSAEETHEFPGGGEHAMAVAAISSRRSLRVMAAVAVALTFSGCDRGPAEPDAARWLSLEIERSEPAGHSWEGLPEPEVEEDGHITKMFFFPPGFLSLRIAEENQSVDPFADPVPESPHLKKQWSARACFESYGIEFGPGASAGFIPATSRVIVRQTPEQMEQVEAIIESIRWGSIPAIIIRVEIFELSDRLALPLIRSAGPHHDHSPEHRAVSQLLRDGEAALVQSVNLVCRSGWRSRIEDGYEIARERSPEFRWAIDVEKSAPWRVGTFLEVDPVLGADEQTIDIILTLAIHGENPARQGLPSGPVAGNAAGETSKRFPGFSRKTLGFQDMARHGEMRLIGAWISDSDGRGNEEVMYHLVFLQATVTRPDPYHWP